MRAIVFEGVALDCKQHTKSFLLKSYEDMRNQASGGVQPNLNLQIVRSIAIPLPPLSEQAAIQGVLFAQLESANAQQAALRLSFSQSTAQRQKHPPAPAFAGQLVPQDSNDEPAAVLLDRIRAERAANAKPKKLGRRNTITQD